MSSAKKNKFSKAWLQDHLNDPYVKMAQREGYRARAAYKLKTAIILSLAALAAWNPRFVPLFWLPVFASFMSLSGHCPGTLAVHLLTRNVGAQEPPHDESL